MARKKVNLAYITDDSTRKTTFRKRKKGLLKKVKELSILCGIDACGIIYSPYDTEPEVFPSPMETKRVLNAFKEMPEVEQSRKMINQESFLRQRISKAKDQLKKQNKENRDKEMTQVMFQGLSGMSLHHLNQIDLNDLGCMIDKHLNEINKRVDGLKTLTSLNVNSELDTSAPISTVVTKPNSDGQNDVEKGMADVNIDNLRRQQWFMEVDETQQHLELGGNETMLHLDDNNSSGLWSNMLFP